MIWRIRVQVWCSGPLCLEEEDCGGYVLTRVHLELPWVSSQGEQAVKWCACFRFIITSWEFRVLLAELKGIHCWTHVWIELQIHTTRKFIHGTEIHVINFFVIYFVVLMRSARLTKVSLIWEQNSRLYAKKIPGTARYESWTVSARVNWKTKKNLEQFFVRFKYTS